MFLNKLTKKQTELMEVVKNEWINLALYVGDEIDEQKTREGINWLYEITKLPKPHIVFVDSPMGVQLATNLVIELCKNDGNNSVRNSVGNSVGDSVWNSVRDSVGNSVGDSVRDSVGNSVRDSVWNSVRDSVRDSVWNSVRDSVWNSVRNSVWNSVGNSVRDSVGDSVRDSVWNSVRDSVWNSVWNSVRDSVRDSVRNSKLTYYWFCYESLGWASGWVSYYDYFRRIGIVKTPEFDKYVEYLQGGVFMSVFQEGLAVVCRRPKFLTKDDNGRLHSQEKATIGWRDGYEVYYLHGVNFDKKTWKKVIDKKMTFKQVMAIQNIEQRMAVLKVYGSEFLLDKANAKLIEKSDKGNELFLIKDIFSQSQDAYYLRYSDPSTGRVYVSGIDPEVGKQGSADLGMCWKFSLKLSEYLGIKAES